MMQDVLQRLAEGDKRTTGAANEVAKEILVNPPLFAKVFQGLYIENALVRMRCADALEKASASNPSLLTGYAPELLGAIGAIPQQEVQWHVAAMLPRCDLTDRERSQAIDLLRHYFDTSKSNIVRTFSLQGIVDIARQDDRFMMTARECLDQALGSDAPSLQSRAKRLEREVNEDEA